MYLWRKLVLSYSQLVCLEWCFLRWRLLSGISFPFIQKNIQSMRGFLRDLKGPQLVCSTGEENLACI